MAAPLLTLFKNQELENKHTGVRVTLVCHSPHRDTSRAMSIAENNPSLQDPLTAGSSQLTCSALNLPPILHLRSSLCVEEHGRCPKCAQKWEVWCGGCRNTLVLQRTFCFVLTIVSFPMVTASSPPACIRPVESLVL